MKTEWKVKYYCYDGGHGWGETGGVTNIIFKEYSPTLFQSHAPGGWEIVAIDRVTIE